MVYHYRSVRCPKCDMVAERTRTVDSQILKGSPFRVCPHCGQVYFDSMYHEAAIEVFKDKGGELNIWGLLWALISNGFVIGSIISAIMGNEIIWPPFILFLILSLVIDIGVIRMIKNRIQADAYHKKSLDVLEGKTTPLTGELAAFMDRMSNRAYLNALKAHGVFVPDYFFQRLSKGGTSSFVMPNNVIAVDAKKIQQSTQEVDDKPTTTSVEADNKQEKSIPIEAAFCRKCGAKMPADSAFCPKCGEKVISVHL